MAYIGVADSSKDRNYYSQHSWESQCFF